MNAPVKVMLVEDNPEFRKVLRLALSRDAAIELASARSMAQVGLPHVTLLAGQPDLTNPEVAAHVAKRDAQAETLLLLPPDENPDAPAVAGAPCWRRSCADRTPKASPGKT